MKYFVNKDSIVRKIWGNGDTILLIFAGASAEFALNKAVDWLYFTGKLPADPLKRLFSTVAYARQIVFSDYNDANIAIDKINGIHKGLEKSRGKTIPDWAYRDVLYMLIDYSIRSFELLERPLSITEKEEVFEVFYRMGARMELVNLPQNYQEWQILRNKAVNENLINGNFTKDLYKQYRKHLVWFRYQILLQAQMVLVPKRVNKLLNLGYNPMFKGLIKVYQLSKRVGICSFIKCIIMPPEYKKEIIALDN